MYLRYDAGLELCAVLPYGDIEWSLLLHAHFYLYFHYQMFLISKISVKQKISSEMK